MNINLFTSTIIAGMGIALATGPLKAGGGGGGDSWVDCPKGYIYSKSKKKCVRRKSSVLPDGDKKALGWALAKRRAFHAAITYFKSVKNDRDAEKWNGMGYSYRKLGLFTKSLAFYKKALSIDPDYVLAREYLGEGYVAAGRVDLARRQLNEIAQRCGKGCKHYVKLAAVIDNGTSGDW